MAANNNERQSVSDELALLQLEEAKLRISEMRSTKEMREVGRRAVEVSLTTERIRREGMQAACWHKKGGRGSDAMYRGTDANYAVAKHILPHGVTMIVCFRCGKVWMPPDVALNRRGASPEDHKRYQKELVEYHEALNFPTDNTTSGSQIFLVTETQPVETAA